MKIYPIIYAPALFLAVGDAPLTSWRSVLDRRRWLFTIASAATFFALTRVMYGRYGDAFLHETYLYHVTRTDPRHNFSVYFYQLYLQSSQLHRHGSALAALAPFVPQLALVLALSWRYGTHDRLHVALFALTVLFVALNKVCTVQYFVWYLSLLPLLVPHWTAKRPPRTLFVGAMLWLGCMAAWLGVAYQLEFAGESVFLSLWSAGVAFFVANIVMLATILYFIDV